MELLNYSLQDTVIPEACSCKYLGIILRSDLSWADQVNYTVKKAWKALHFTMCILKMGNRNTKSLAHTSLVHPIFEYCVLGSLQDRTDKCARPGAKYSG
jgi:hypothetical protein